MAKLSFTPKSADFGTLKINQTSYKDTLVTFKNTGNDTVRGNISVIGKGFSIDKTNLLIAPMDSVIRTVRFAPAESGKADGMLIITSNDPSSPDTVYLTGIGEIATGVSDNSELPRVFSLSQNYPNPFNPSTTIEFQLPGRATMKITVYNMLGQEVGVIADGEFQAGVHQANWNAKNMPSGAYVYRINAGKYSAVKHMLLVK